MGKEVLDLSSGSFLGRAQSITVHAHEQRVVGVTLKQKGLLGGKNIIPLANIKAFGSHTITVTGLENVMALEGVDILNMSVVTIDGTVLGKVLDFIFEPDTGVITDYVLNGGILQDQPAKKGMLGGRHVVSIGRDVIIAQEKIDLADLVSYEDTFGDSWQEIDELMEGMSADISDSDLENELEDVVDDFAGKINKTIDEMSEKLKEVNTEEFADKIKLQANKLTDEAKELLELVKAKFAAKDKAEPTEADLAGQIVEQLRGSTVDKPLLDAQGNVIIWPGQVIGLQEVRMAVQTGKLQELIGSTVALETSDDLETPHAPLEKNQDE